MADNNEFQPIGAGRFVLVDPNKFSDQYIGVKDNDFYNFSVPLEDLCISAELKTYKKNRTLLTQDGTQYGAINQTSGQNGIVMIPTGHNHIVEPGGIVRPDDPKNDSGYITRQNWLTTSYTDISTELGKDDEEVLGMTNIEISFDSQIAPMISIDFVDPRGAAIFQNGGRSKYSVFFTLPYPLFELTIKGFYGRPVRYCLHLTKFNSRFNSQTGNFEINTKFVGYTYALLSDMIFGYLRAIGWTERGRTLLKERGVIPLNDFLLQSSSIESKIKEAIDSTDNTEFNDLKVLQEIDKEYDNIVSLINEYAGLLKSPPSKYPTTESNNINIIIVNNPSPNLGDGNVSDPENETKIAEFEKKYKEFADKINGKIGENNDLKIDTSKDPLVPRFSTQLTPIDIFFSTNLSQDQKVSVDQLTNTIKEKYKITEIDEVNEIVKSLKAACINVQANPLIKFYDFTILNKNIQISQSLLAERIKEVRTASSELLQEKLRQTLNFDTSIKSIFEILTTHVDIFLQILYEYSKAAEESQPRKEQLKKFLENLDIPEKNENDQTEQAVYPWPEYYELDEEKYLGSQPGPLTDPSVIPEIQFVEMLFEGMIKNRAVDEQIKSNINLEDQTWLSFNPADCKFYYPGTDINNPYGRLGDNPLPEDIARLFVLRSMAFTNFNLLLSEDDINNFVNSEASLIIKRFKDNTKILQGLNQNFTNPDQFIKIKGTIGSEEANKQAYEILKSATTDTINVVEYAYIYSRILPVRNRSIIPISDSFSDAIYQDPYLASGPVETPKIYLSNVTYKSQDEKDLSDRGQKQLNDLPPSFKLEDVPSLLTKLKDKAFYLNIIEQRAYEDGTSNGPQKTFSSDVFNTLFDSKDKVTSVFTLFSGKYGVLDFTKVTYESLKIAGEKPFYTFFYGQGKGFVKYTEKTTETNYYNPKSQEIDVAPFEENLLTPAKDSSVFTWEFWKNITSVLDENASVHEAKIYSIYQSVDANINNFNDVGAFIPFFGFGMIAGNGLFNFPLFGSRFYYGQTINGQSNDEAKAFLFLHCFPWKGLSFNDTNPNNITLDKIGIFNPTNSYNLSENTPILNLFQFRSGFIQVPELWSAFIGGLLWRYLSDTDPITWFYTDANGKEQSLIKPNKGDYDTTTNKYKPYDLYPPKKDEYLKVSNNNSSMSFTDSPTPSGIDVLSVGGNYKKIEDVIIRLPDPVKITFLTAFNNFVTIFKSEIKNLFELKFNGVELNANGWTSAMSNAYSNINNNKISVSNIPFTVTDNSNNKLNLSDVFDSFVIFRSPIDAPFIPTSPRGSVFSLGLDCIDFRYKKDSLQSKKLVELFTKYNYIANCSPIIWTRNEAQQGTKFIPTSLSECTGVDFKFRMSGDFFQKIADQFKKNIADEVEKSQGLSYTKDELEQVKFQIYRNCKAIYDKWIAGSSNAKDSVFQCCKTPKEKEAVNSVKFKDNGELKLIDSFRFVNRSFSDIGTISQINPLIISKQVVENSNISFYQVIQRVLTDNNFVFTPLPTFINYNDPKDLKNMFKPIPCKDFETDIIAGPSFVCTYVGQTSTKLDLSNPQISQHKNDSFDFTDETSIPTDFKEPLKDGENTCAAFIVRYGQQNQNIFKDINLDQEEFNETDESLQITDNIANFSQKANRTFVGQNLYSVFSIRSYSAEIEMMGNAQIQPMMYFQLENIPMFHGGYMITRVNHSIKPNYMSTRFKGTRIKKIATPIVDAQALYGSILDGYDLGASKGSLSTTRTYTVKPIAKTIANNDGKNGELTETFGQLKMTKVPDIDGVNNEKRGSNTGSNTDFKNPQQLSEYMLEEATNALVKMLTDYVAFAKANAYKSVGGNYIGITSLYRNKVRQADLSANNSNPAAKAGTSYHGWGLAVDLKMIDETTGNYINNDFKNKVGFDSKRNLALAWLYKNMWKYGFWVPISLRDNSGYDEFWHVEYHGTSAICLWNKYPSDGYGNRIEMPNDSINQLDAIVLNPKEPNGQRAIYDVNSCDDTTVTFGESGSDLTKSSSKDKQQNMLVVKQYLKSFFLGKKYSEEDAKALTAGIMGNMYIESFGFDPNASGEDRNEKTSYGLIQWNLGSYPNALLPPKEPDPKREGGVGNTAESQVKKLVDGYTFYFNDFLDDYTKNPSVNGETKAFSAGFYFAKNVERCSYCVRTKKKDAYSNFKEGGVIIYRGEPVTVKPVKRSNAAESFANRFDDQNDYLYWPSDVKNVADYKEPVTSINNTGNNSGTGGSFQSKNIVTIGDSLSVGLSVLYPKIKRDPFISVGGWGINKLITEIKKLQPNPNFDTVIISMGSNDLWKTTKNRVLELLEQVDRVYPSVQKVYILNGNYGWGGLTGLSDDEWKKRINEYLGYFLNSGKVHMTAGGLIGTNIIFTTTHPAATNNDAFYLDKKADLNSKIFNTNQTTQNQTNLKPTQAKPKTASEIKPGNFGLNNPLSVYNKL